VTLRFLPTDGGGGGVSYLANEKKLLRLIQSHSQVLDMMDGLRLVRMIAIKMRFKSSCRDFPGYL
jgi:hypothetical protein